MINWRLARILGAAVLVTMLTGEGQAQGLPPEARMLVLTEQANNALARKDDREALKLFADMNAIAGVKRPPETYVIEAKLAGNAKDYGRAKRALNGYFNVAQPSHVDYKEAVRVYATLEGLEKEAAAKFAIEIESRTFRDRFPDGSEGPTMVRVPSGSFIMGSPQTELGRDGDEGPQHTVTIGYPVAVGKYEVTWGEYQRCVVATWCAKVKDDGFGQGERPVTSVSWSEAKAYAAWLSVETGQTYRLLSEAEWEYAARAGTTAPFSFGSAISDADANYDATQTYGTGVAGRKTEKTVPVGQYAPNAFGLYDMHGNVWEWVEDCYQNSYSAGQPRDGGAYVSGSCSIRGVRGGTWNSNPLFLRSANRYGFAPSEKGDLLGFRVARALP